MLESGNASDETKSWMVKHIGLSIWPETVASLVAQCCSVDLQFLTDTIRHVKVAGFIQDHPIRSRSVRILAWPHLHPIVEADNRPLLDVALGKQTLARPQNSALANLDKYALIGIGEEGVSAETGWTSRLAGEPVSLGFGQEWHLHQALN